MTALNLCANCLEGEAAGVDVGPEKGTQRDPYRDTLALCEICKSALLSGDLGSFSARYRDARVIKRSAG